VLPWNGAVD